MEKSLKEVCELCMVSRRAVQGYEKAGLVSASAYTNRGYLLYDDSAQERIRQIKMYQELGFSIKEIVQVIDRPLKERKEAIELKLIILEEERGRLDNIITYAHKLIEQLSV